mgnify:CR=1 FL=1
MNDVKSLSHTSWNCKYHIVFALKYRRKVFYDSKRLEIGKILRELCNWKGITIIEAEVCPNHIHMLIEIPPKYSVSRIMGFLKGKVFLEFEQPYINFYAICQDNVFIIFFSKVPFRNIFFNFTTSFNLLI